MTSLARCYLLMGDWKYAEMAAEVVLEVDKYFVKAIYAKAEALYNTCQFEHALVLFHRGLVIIGFFKSVHLIDYERCGQAKTDRKKNNLLPYFLLS